MKTDDPTEDRCDVCGLSGDLDKPAKRCRWEHADDWDIGHTLCYECWHAMEHADDPQTAAGWANMIATIRRERIRERARANTLKHRLEHIARYATAAGAADAALENIDPNKS